MFIDGIFIGGNMSKRKKKMTVKQLRALVAFLVVINIILLICVLVLGIFLAKANSGKARQQTVRLKKANDTYTVCVDAGHGGSDPGARGVVEEKEMTAQTSEALLALLEADPNYIPLRSRESYDVTAKPSERAEAINAQSPQLLLSIHGNSAPEGSTAAGFECYPSVPGRTWHQESYYFAQQLAQGMQAAGAKLRGHGGIRYIYYQGEVKQLVESTHTEVRDERSFTLLEDVNCPAVLAEQCFVTSEEDVAQFGSEEGCKTVARAYYEAICAYFGTQPLDTPL